MKEDEGDSFGVVGEVRQRAQRERSDRVVSIARER